MRRWLMRGAVGFAMVAFFVPAAEAQDLGYNGAGIRGGLNTHPNQFQIGAQVNAGEFISAVRFQPSFTIGLGDNRTIFMAYIDAAYHVPIDGETWNPYIGGGLGIGIDVPDEKDTKVKAGLNILGGIEWGAARYRYFVEVRTQVGTGLADFTVLVGINF